MTTGIFTKAAVQDPQTGPTQQEITQAKDATASCKAISDAKAAMTAIHNKRTFG